MHRIQDALTSWETGILGAYLSPIVLHNVYFFLRCSVFEIHFQQVNQVTQAVLVSLQHLQHTVCQCGKDQQV